MDEGRLKWIEGELTDWESGGYIDTTEIIPIVRDLFDEVVRLLGREPVAAPPEGG